MYKVKSTNQQKKNTVLIVDDQSSNIMALSHTLNRDYTVLVARSGEEGIKAAEKHAPNIILLDVVMPDMDGFAVIDVLKSTEKTKDIPVIFITSLDDAENESKGFALGASDYITKPFSPAIVRLRVNNQIKIINQTRLIIEQEIADKTSRATIEFLLRMNHEMLTPMNAIMGFTQLLKSLDSTAYTNEETQEFINEIDISSRHLLSLIHNLLDVSGQNSNSFELVNEEFSFTKMLEAALNETEQSAARKNQSISVDLAANIPEKLIGDSARLSQVITNLMMNAIKFTPERGKIRLSATVQERSDRSANEKDDKTVALKVVVTDNGIGIPEEKQREIFNMFVRGSSNVMEHCGGIGLGLPISKRIVEMMGGELTVVSESGKGSKFTFTFKLEEK